MMSFSQFQCIVLLLFVCSTSSNLVRIVPYLPAKHTRLLAVCAQQHFEELFTNLAGYESIQKRYEYGLKQANYFDKMVNEQGDIINQNGSTTHIRVGELSNHDAVGYIKFSVGAYHPAIVTIDQFAILKAYQKKGYGQEMMSIVLDGLCAIKNMQMCILSTTNTQVGEFYKKFGFIQLQTREIENSKLYDYGLVLNN